MNKAPENKTPVIEGLHQDKAITITPNVTYGTMNELEQSLDYGMEQVYQNLKNGDVGVKISILALILAGGNKKYPDGAPTNDGKPIDLDIETAENIVIGMSVREANALCEWLVEEVRQVNPKFFDKMDEAWDNLNKRFTEGDFSIAPSGEIVESEIGIDEGGSPNPNPPPSKTG